MLRASVLTTNTWIGGEQNEQSNDLIGLLLFIHCLVGRLRVDIGY